MIYPMTTQCQSTLTMSVRHVVKAEVSTSTYSHSRIGKKTAPLKDAPARCMDTMSRTKVTEDVLLTKLQFLLEEGAEIIIVDDTVPGVGVALSVMVTV